ncbi:SPOR domain-containing protein [Grimontia sp. S25]|uniref:SPOR domain-containing protein n=1 Tax=Grimontia sedimenti TaxID=2711294 RepID=A0A6M1RGQ5_9GAMM|nr:SPOR domain-containing protein [Grimontia sedimenti]NGN99304.1 SPOR domain-containing protein [Grimontia sedimenti]
MHSRSLPVLKLVLSSFLLIFSTSVFASEDLDARCKGEKSSEGYSVVGESCPIGEGLWGRKPAKSGAFWVQCGIYAELPEQNEAINGALYRKEGRQYRCLAGPFDSFGEAIETRNDLRAQAETADAFIRQVGYQPGVEKTVLKTKPASAKKGLIRHQEQVLGFWAPKPKGMDTRYTINRRDWWRATYQEANNACLNNGKKLVSERSLRNAISTSRGVEALPDLYPYWLSNGQVYDIKLDMSFVAISDTLTLNVLCE